MKKSWQIFFVALLANLLAAGAYSYVFLKIRQENRHISELSASTEILADQKQNLSSVKKTFTETAFTRDQLDDYFISKDGLVQFLNSIQTLGAGNRLALKVLSVNASPAAAAPDTFESVKANIEVSGGWSDVYRFAALLELMPMKISVDRVDLEKISDGEKIAAAPTGKSLKKPASAGALWKGTFDVNVLKLK